MLGDYLQTHVGEVKGTLKINFVKVSKLGTHPWPEVLFYKLKNGSTERLDSENFTSYVKNSPWKIEVTYLNNELGTKWYN